MGDWLKAVCLSVIAIILVAIVLFYFAIIITIIGAFACLALTAHIFGVPFYVTVNGVRTQKYIRVRRVPLE